MIWGSVQIIKGPYRLWPCSEDLSDPGNMLQKNAMDFIDTVQKAASYGSRHLLQLLDYRFGRGLSVPDNITCTLTHRCNCQCLMCNIWKVNDYADELPSERWIAILEDLHSWIGTFRLALIGGEIFLKPGIYNILRRAVDLGLTINPVSNGLAFDSEKHFHRLMDTGLKSITFSLDGKDPLIHDKYRGIPTIHAVVTGVIQRIKRENPGMSVSVVCIIMRETVSQLAEFAQWAEDLGVDAILFQPIAQAPLSPEKTADWYKESNLFVSDLKSLESSFKDLLRIKSKTNRIELTEDSLRLMQEYFSKPEEVQMKGSRCLLGQTDLRINPQGIVYICDVRHTTIGHVNDQALCDLWNGEQARIVRRQIKECRRPCSALCHRSPKFWEKAALFLRYARSGRL